MGLLGMVPIGQVPPDIAVMPDTTDGSCTIVLDEPQGASPPEFGVSYRIGANSLALLRDHEGALISIDLFRICATIFDQLEGYIRESRKTPALGTAGLCPRPESCL